MRIHAIALLVLPLLLAVPALSKTRTRTKARKPAVTRQAPSPRKRAPVKQPTYTYVETPASYYRTPDGDTYDSELSIDKGTLSFPKNIGLTVDNAVKRSARVRVRNVSNRVKPSVIITVNRYAPRSVTTPGGTMTVRVLVLKAEVTTPRLDPGKSEWAVGIAWDQSRPSDVIESENWIVRPPGWRSIVPIQ